MGRLIDTSELAKRIALQKKRFGDLLEVPICNVFADMIRDTPTAEAIPKADYEARLKADLEAILVELQLEIEELDSNHTMPDVWSNQASKEIWNTALKLIEEIIEVRINNLKGMTKDGKESG